MTRVRRLDGIDGQHPEGIDTKLIEWSLVAHGVALRCFSLPVPG